MNAKCPKDSGLIRLFMNETPVRETEKLLRHLAACARCAARFSVLRQIKRDLRPQIDAFSGEFSAAEAGPILRRAAFDKLQALRPSHAPSPSRIGTRFFASLLSLKFAAGFLAALLLVSVLAYFAVYKAQRRSELRSPSLILTLSSPVGSLSATPRVFRWTPVLNAEEYDFELFDDSLERLHVGSIFLINEIVLPAEVRSRVVKGRVYLWSVTARDADRNLLTSRSASFVIE